MIFETEPLLPTQTRCDGPSHERLDAGVRDGLSRHLKLFSPALGVDHARRGQALDRIHPGSRQCLGGGREHDLINPIATGGQQHLVGEGFDALDQNRTEDLDT